MDYAVPVELVGALAAFDGSVMVERTTGELSARCHDEQANMLALNLADELFQIQSRQEGERVEIMEKVAALTEELTHALEG